MTTKASVAIVPIIHSALSVIVETNFSIAPAFGGAAPVTPAARNAHICPTAMTPYTAATNTPTERRQPTSSKNIEEPPGSRDQHGGNSAHVASPIGACIALAAAVGTGGATGRAGAT